MQLREARIILRDIKRKGTRTGLTKEDYYTLKKLLKSINEDDLTPYNYWTDIYVEAENILMKIYASGIINKFSLDTLNYVLKHAYLLPLVFANNGDKKITISGANTYFNCQFHKEDTPSMRVNDLGNKLTCYACGINADVISYLLMYEKLSTKQAIDLLSQIYLFDVGTTDESLKQLVDKYQKYIISDEYKEILKENKRRIELMNHSLSEEDSIESSYEERFETIDRVKNHEYDKKYHHESVPKVMYLGK